jgi:hypothetical protein
MAGKAFKIKQVKPNIFLFEFKHNYDMCMHFLRYQEFYECPSSKFRGKPFELIDYMRWYSMTFGKGDFTYPTDWSGFNLFDGNIIKQVYDLGIADRNLYDYEMLNAWRECNTKVNGGKFCIIGAIKGDDETLRHEMAHAFFALSDEYKKHMTKLVKALDPVIRKETNSTLKRIGYTPKVYVDETQAYMATGLTKDFGDVYKWVKEQWPFENYYDEFSRITK